MTDLIGILVSTAIDYAILRWGFHLHGPMLWAFTYVSGPVTYRVGQIHRAVK